MAENDRVAEFLRESGLDKLLDKLTPEEAQRARHEITARLKAIAENAPKVEEGGTKVVIGDWSVHLTGAVWPLAKLAAKLAIAVHDPVGLTWASAADGVLQALTIWPKRFTGSTPLSSTSARPSRPSGSTTGRRAGSRTARRSRTSRPSSPRRARSLPLTWPGLSGNCARRRSSSPTRPRGRTATAPLSETRHATRAKADARTAAAAPAARDLSAAAPRDTAGTRRGTAAARYGAAAACYDGSDARLAIEEPGPDCFAGWTHLDSSS